MTDQLMTDQPPSAPLRFWQRIRLSPGWMFGIAFGLRVLAIVLLHSYKFRTTDKNFSFGWEMGRIAASIASGHGFSNPFHDPTGPTAWEPPLYCYLTAGVFQLFGIYSHLSSFVLLTLNSLFSALTCIPVFFISRRCFGERVAIGAAWTWALLPYAMYWSVRWVWETSLSALLLATIFWVVITLEEREGLKPWALFGLLWGVAALNSPVLVGFLPASGLYAWYRRWKLGKRSLAGVALASVMFFGCITPWLVRDYQTFHKFIFIRANFGAELRLGNGPGANGMWMWFIHPTHDDLQFARYRQMGETAYVQARKQEALAWIKQDPARFLRVSLNRFIYYWYGVPRPDPWAVETVKHALFTASSVLMAWGLFRAMRRRRPHAWLFFWLMLMFPLVYYVVFPHPRYRHPLEPEMTILAVYLICEASTP